MIKSIKSFNFPIFSSHNSSLFNSKDKSLSSLISVTSSLPAKYLDINLLVAAPKFLALIVSLGLFCFTNFSIILFFVSSGINILYTG